MNQVLLSPSPVGAGSPSPAETAVAATKTTALAIGTDFFRAALAARLLTAVPAKSRQAGSIAGDTTTRAALETNVANMIESGASQADVIALLAGQLASAVAHQLGARGADARGTLQTVFATALAPPGESGGAAGSVADRARTLAQRYIRLEGMASSIAGGQSAQQNRITGNLLDAQRAKDIPARAATTATNTPAATTAAASRVGVRGTAVQLSPSPAPELSSAASASADLSQRALCSKSAVSATGTGGVRGPTVALGWKTAPAGDTSLAATTLIRRSGETAPADAAPFAAATSFAAAPPVGIGSASLREPAPEAAANPGADLLPPLELGHKPATTGKMTAPPGAGAVGVRSPFTAKPAPHATAEATAFWSLAISPTGVNDNGVHRTGKLGSKAATNVANARATANVQRSAAILEIEPAFSPAGAEPGALRSSSRHEPAGSAAASAGRPSRAVSVMNGDGDDRTVDFDSRTASATGGDTSLGRILTRAVLAADARQAPLAPRAADVPSAAAASDGTRPNAEPSDTVPSDTALSTFVKQFEAALDAQTPTDAARPVPHVAQSAAALFLTAHEAAPVPAALSPAVAPFPIDRADFAAVSAAAPAAAPLDHSAIADQVLRGAFMRNVGESSEIRLTLVPNSLGDVTVKLVVNAGSVTAHVLAQTPEVRDALVAAQPQLTKSLADAGLKLASFTVDLSSSGFAGFSQQQNDQSQNGNRSRRSTSSADADGDSNDVLLDAIPSFGPSTVTQPHVGDYNYLA